MPARKHTTFTSLATLVALGLAAATAHAQSPIAVGGYDSDVIYSAGETLAGTSPLDIENGYALYSASQNPDGGLPTNGTITSATDSGFTYQLGNYTSTNALVMTQAGYGGMPSTGVLAPLTISSYSSLALLTASTDGGSYGTGLVHYTDGTSSPFSYNAPDWYNTDGATTEGRVNLDSGDYDTSGPGLSETIINVDPTRQVALLTFNGASYSDPDASTAIFALSGSQTVAATNLVNGGFENNLAGWNYTGQYSGTVTGDSHSGTTAFSFYDYVATPAQLSQVVATQTGQNYTVTFYAKSDSGPNTFSASFGGQSLFSGSLPTDDVYRQYTYNVTATSGSTALLFTGGDDDNRIWLDDVSLVAAAPEPSQYAAMGLGVLSLAGLVLKARRSRATAA
jgi:hypothetical protein